MTKNNFVSPSKYGVENKDGRSKIKKNFSEILIRQIVNTSIENIYKGETANIIKHLTSVKGPLNEEERNNVNINLFKLHAKKGSLKPDTLEKNINEALIRIEEVSKEDITKMPISQGNNTKLGKECATISFELALFCSGIDCQACGYCYAKQMECGSGKNRIQKNKIRQNRAWNELSDEDISNEMYKIMSKKCPTMRFCETGDVPNQELLDKLFRVINLTHQKLKADEKEHHFYIYSTRYDLDWSKKPDVLIVNASNDKMHQKVPDSNRFIAVESYEDIPDGAVVCSCNCIGCDYCSTLKGFTICELLRK